MWKEGEGAPQVGSGKGRHTDLHHLKLLCLRTCGVLSLWSSDLDGEVTGTVGKGNMGAEAWRGQEEPQFGLNTLVAT